LPLHEHRDVCPAMRTHIQYHLAFLLSENLQSKYEGIITIGIFCNILLVFVLTYLASKFIHFSYEDATPTAIIAGSNHFEVAVAVATAVFGMALSKDKNALLQSTVCGYYDV